MSAPKVDVLAWFDDYIRRCGVYDDGTPIRAAVAELIDIQRRLVAWNRNVNGTGEELGQICADAENALARIGGAE